jgi:hypothetical protein
MRHVGVAVSTDRKSRQFRIFFAESDVRRACGMLLCGSGADTCMESMEQRGMTCELCYAVLTALRKYPVKIAMDSQSPSLDRLMAPERAA